MKEYSVKNKLCPPELSDVEIGGETKKLMDTFFHERIFSTHAKNVIYKEAEDAFGNQVDDTTAVGYWQGEFRGKWIISARKVYKYTKAKELLLFLKKAAENMISYQRADGYIGTYKDSSRFMKADNQETRKIVGWDCVGTGTYNAENIPSGAFFRDMR